MAFIALGTAFGAFLGQFVGVDEAEKCRHLYCRGVELVAQLVAVRADDEFAERAMNLLRAQRIAGMTIL